MSEEEKRTTFVDCTKDVDEYINKSNWRINANSNIGYSHPALINTLAGKVIANYWLDNIYPKELADLHRSGAVHIHDLDCLAPYCAGHDLNRLLTEGFNGVEGRVSSKAPKHFREALGQMANYIGILQGEWAGAQAFSSFDTLLAPYVFFDMYYNGLKYEDIKKAILQFIYNLNVPSRWGQAPFSNITLDRIVPQDMRDQYPMRGGEQYFVSIIKEYFSKGKEYNGNFIIFINEAYKRLRETEEITENNIVHLFESGTKEEILDTLSLLSYKHFKKEMGIIIKAFYECLNEGDLLGQPFTFPIPTVNITEDFDWDSEESNIIFENAAKYGSSYFQNFIGSQYKRNPETGKLESDPNAYRPSDVRSMCCRLQLDKRALRKKGGGLFGADAQTGSIGNITFNMPRLGYLYKGDYESLLKKVDEYLDLSVIAHEAKRKFVTELNEKGFFPFTRRWIKTFDTFFSTIGLNGMNEMVRNFTNDQYDITSEYGQKMCKDIMDHIRERLLEIQERTDHLYNLEASPGEGTMRRFARTDHDLYPGIIQAGDGNGVPYYTNSAQLPVEFSDDVFAALDLQDELQQKWSGGTVFHVYTNEQMSTETCKTLVKKILTNYRLPYISITPTLCVCPIHGRLDGYHEYCPICDKELIKKHAEEVDINL